MDNNKSGERLMDVINKCVSFSIKGSKLKVNDITLFGEFSNLYIERIKSLFNNKNLKTIDFSNLSVYELAHGLQTLSDINFDIISLMSDSPISKRDFIYLYNYLVKFLNAAYCYNNGFVEEYIKDLANIATIEIYSNKEKNIYRVAKRCYGGFDNCKRNFERALMSAVDMNKVISKNSKGGKK